jgi:tetratricopeptide (TPR) repeat protein
MFKTLLVILMGFLLVSCSSNKEITGENKSKGDNSSYTDLKKQAVDHFISGSAFEANGDYASAIIEFQDALRLDPQAGIYYALAKNYFYLDKISLALQNSKKSVELDSNQIEYLNLLADIFSAAHQYDSASVSLEKIIAIDSSEINAYYKLARNYENSKPLKAIALYNKIGEIIGPDWNILLRLAELNERMGNLDQAAINIEELLTIDPGNISIKKLLIDYYQRAKKYDAALRVVEDILELMPDDLELRERKANIFLEQNDWENAAKEYNYIMEQPDIPLDIKIKIGASYFNKTFTDSSLLPVAKSFFERIDKDTIDWQIKMYLGAIALSENDDSSAIKNFKLVTELARWNADAWIRLGGVYFDNRKYEEASKVMYEAVESFPDDFAINLILGLSLAQMDKHPEAKPFLAKAVDLNSNDITALSAYAYTLNQVKEDEEAVKYLKKALDIQPDDVNLLGTLGLIFDSQENWAACDSIYRRALEIDSLNALVNNNYAYSLSERGIKLDEALKMAQIAVNAEPDNTSYLDTIGWVYFKLGNYSDAKTYLEKAIEIGGEKAVMLEHLGDVIYMMGQKDQAKLFWQKAFELDDSNNQLKLKIEKGEI